MSSSGFLRQFITKTSKIGSFKGVIFFGHHRSAVTHFYGRLMPTKTHHPGPPMQSRYCGLGSNCGSNLNALGHSASNDASSCHRSGFGWQAGYFYSVVSCLRWKLLHVMCKLSCCNRGFWWRPAYWVFLFSTQVFVLCFQEVSCLSVNMYTSVSFVTQDNECFDADRWRHHPTADLSGPA